MSTVQGTVKFENIKADVSLTQMKSLSFKDLYLQYSPNYPVTALVPGFAFRDIAGELLKANCTISMKENPAISL